MPINDQLDSTKNLEKEIAQFIERAASISENLSVEASDKMPVSVDVSVDPKASTRNLQREISQALLKFKKRYEVLPKEVNNGSEELKPLYEIPESSKIYISAIEKDLFIESRGPFLRDLLTKKIDIMPGFFSFFNSVRPLTLAIQKILKAYPREALCLSDNVMLSQLVKNEMNAKWQAQDKNIELQLQNEELTKLNMRLENALSYSKQLISASDPGSERIHAVNLEKQCFALGKELKESENKNNVLTETITMLEGENGFLKAANIMLEEANTQLRTCDVNAEQNNLNSRIVKLEAANKELQKLNRVQYAQIESLLTKFEKQLTLTEQLCKKSTEKDGDIELLKDKAAKQDAQISKLMSELEEQRIKADKLLTNPATARFFPESSEQAISENVKKSSATQLQP